jgi:transposase InsO family protein
LAGSDRRQRAGRLEGDGLQVAAEVADRRLVWAGGSLEPAALVTNDDQRCRCRPGGRRSSRRPVGPAPHRVRPRSGSLTGLRLAGLSRLSTFDGPTALPVRYVRDRPGELIHIDVKKLGRIHDGGGHKVLGRAEGRRKKSKRVGTDYLHVAIDDATRLAFVAVHPNELGVTCAQFLDDAAAFFTAAGIPVIERVMTDNAKNYTIPQAFQAALDGLGARHVRIRNYRPQTNGKAERFNRTMLNEWAYARPYLTNNERTEALPAWLEHYNNNRPHTGIGNHPPRHAVNNLTGNNS